MKSTLSNIIGTVTKRKRKGMKGACNLNNLYSTSNERWTIRRKYIWEETMADKPQGQYITWRCNETTITVEKLLNETEFMDTSLTIIKQ